MSNAEAFYGWKLVGVLWLLDFLNMGFPLYGGAVIHTYMVKQIPMSRSTYGFGFTLLNLFVGIPSVIVGLAILRWSIRRAFAIGSALIFAGALWLAVLATKPWHYLVGFGVLAGTGISFGTIVPAATAITRWFKRYRGRAMAVTLSASGFAGFFIAPIINRILAANGGNWRQAWGIVAGVAILSAIIAFSFVKERPEDIGQVADGESAGTTAGQTQTNSLVSKHAWTPKEALATPAYWMIVLGGMACQYPFFFFTAHWLPHLKGAGVQASDAAFAMGLFTLGAVAGRLIGGWLMDLLQARFAFMLGLCCYFAGTALALRVGPHTLWIAYSAAILYGTAFGWTFICMNTATGHFFGPAAFPKVNGMVLVLTGAVCSPAGVIGGKLFDVYGNYGLAFRINVLIAAVGIVALFFARMPHPPVERNTVSHALASAEE
ncbi:MAG TPA: MFS transporter [Candidatus Angelobacter sp.]|nr:MFS transporter [Candidatus Angelobacter sp.]